MTHVHKGSEKIFLAVLIFGSLWGLLDALFASAWISRLAPFLFSKHVCTCALTNVFWGFFILTWAYGVYRKPFMLLGIGMIATIFKVLNLIILTLPVINGVTIYQPVINPAIGSLATSMIFTSVAIAFPAFLETNIVIRGIAGATAGLLTLAAFILLSFFVTHTPPLVTSNPIQFMYPIHAPAAVLLGVISLPSGYVFARRVENSGVFLFRKKVWLRYVEASAIFAGCLGVSALALAA